MTDKLRRNAALWALPALSLCGLALAFWSLLPDNTPAEEPFVGFDPATETPIEPLTAADLTPPAVATATVRGGPAAPQVVAALGGWTTDGDILLAAGGTDAPGDTATYTATCGNTPCAAADTIWTVDGVALPPANPLELRVADPGAHTVTVDVTGRPDSSRVLRAVGIPRSADVPIDGWATGQATPTDVLRALAYADEIGWLPTCQVQPGQPRRLCASPANEIAVVPRQQTFPAAPAPTGDTTDDDQAETDDTAADDIAAAPAPANPDDPIDPLEGITSDTDDPVDVTTLRAPDGTDAIVGDCTDRWTPILVRGEFVLGEGTEPGCVTRAELTTAASDAAGRHVDIPACPPQPEPTPTPTPTTDPEDDSATAAPQEREPLGPPPCGPRAAATIADLYAAAANASLLPDTTTGCATLGLPADCTPATAAVVAAGGPVGPGIGSPDSAAHRGDVALVLAWATGQHWLFNPIATAPPAHADSGFADVTLTLNLPSHWPAATVEWPQPDGTLRNCPDTTTVGTATLTCSYDITVPGTHAGTATITAGPFTTQTTIIVSADPDPPLVTVDTVQQAPGAAAADWRVTSNMAIDEWGLRHDDTSDPATDLSGAGWQVSIVEQTATTVRVRLTGTPDLPVNVIGCASSRCGQTAIGTADSRPVSIGSDGQPVTTGDRTTRLTISGPADLELDLTGHTLTADSPVQLLDGPYGTNPQILLAGQQPTGPVRLITPPWWAPGLGGIDIVLAGPTGSHTLTIHHPDDR